MHWGGRDSSELMKDLRAIYNLWGTVCGAIWRTHRDRGCLNPPPQLSSTTRSWTTCSKGPMCLLNLRGGFTIQRIEWLNWAELNIRSRWGLCFKMLKNNWKKHELVSYSFFSSLQKHRDPKLNWNYVIYTLIRVKSSNVAAMLKALACTLACVEGDNNAFFLKKKQWGFQVFRRLGFT